MKIQRASASTGGATQFLFGGSGRQNGTTKTSSCGGSSPLTKFLLLGLGLLVLLQAEQNVLRRVLHQANESLEEEGGNTNRISLTSPMINAHLSSSSQTNHHTNPDAFSACLVLQNEHENQYLTEWLAYHWHVLPLRRLIVWKDPLSQTNPDAILNKWSDKIDITVWDQPRQIYPVGHPHHKLSGEQDLTVDHHERLQARNARQDVFFGMCLRTLKREQRGWTLLSHTDEYTLINPRVRQDADPLHDEIVRVVEQNNNETIPSQQEPGSVLKWLQRTRSHASWASPYILSQPCIPLTWKQFGTREDKVQDDEAEEVDLDIDNEKPITTTTKFGNATLIQTLQTAPADYLTLRWQYWGRQGHADEDPTRKQLLDLSRIPPNRLRWKVDAHRPVFDEDLCPIHTISERDTLFVVHHYAGTLERVYYGDQRHHHDVDTIVADNLNNNNNINVGNVHNIHDKPLNKEERIHQDIIHTAYWEGNTIPQWLDGFVDSVGGLEEATRLLEGVGQLQ